VIPLLAIFIIKNTTKDREKRERGGEIKTLNKSLWKFIKIKCHTKTPYSALKHKQNY
jgi:hypothetical protein